MADVFISYAREDQERAAQIARGLEAMGLDIFWDTEIPPGQTWADYIEGKLSACKAVIVLWSEHSTRSQWVREEARMGKEKAKLIPALLDASPAPFGFGEVQAANLANWNGATNAPEWTRFSQAVFTAVNGAGAGPPPQAASVAPAYTPPPRAHQHIVTDGAVEQLSPIGYVQKCFRLYANGKGRARRAEYWWWVLFTVVLNLVATLLDIMAFGFNTVTSQANTAVFSFIASLGVLAPSIAVMSRRFHDIGLNGWLVAAVFGAYFVAAMMMAAMMPMGAVLFGATVLVALVITIIPSKAGPNQYGPNPKGE